MSDDSDMTDEAYAEAYQNRLDEEVEANSQAAPVAALNEPGLGLNAFLDFRHAFLRCSVNNDFYASGSFHLIFGQLPHIRNIRASRGNGSSIDARMHVAFLAPSASGKGEGLKFIARMCEATGIKLQMVDRVTDAGLIGTWRRDEEGELHYSPGWLHPDSGIDILAAKEATNVIKDVSKDRDAQDLMNTFQTLMNDMGSADGRISKKLAEGDVIEFNPTCSLLFTSFMLPYMDEVLLERGLFQRMYLIIKEATMKTRLADGERLRQIQNEDIDTQHLEEDIARRLMLIDNAYAGVTTLTISPGASKVFEEQARLLIDNVIGLNPSVQDMLMPFLGRFETLQTKVALHFACLNLHSRIEKVDAETSAHFTSKLLQSIITFLILRAKPHPKAERLVEQIIQRTTHVVARLLLNSKYVNSSGYVEAAAVRFELTTRHKMTPHVAHTYLEKLEGWNLAQYREYEGVKYFRIKGLKHQNAPEHLPRQED